MSWTPVTTSARPSASTRTVAWAGGPPPPHQIWVAQPIPRSSPSGCGSRSAVARAPARELRGAVVAREQPLARVRQPGGLVAVDVVAAPQLERVEPERRGELVHRLLEHRDPSTTPGARNAFCARMLVRTGKVIVWTFSQA